MSKEHSLKVWPGYFEALKDGSKTFEYRQNDRDYQVGDTIKLMEWDPNHRAYTGREITAEITYTLRTPAHNADLILGIKQKRQRLPFLASLGILFVAAVAVDFYLELAKSLAGFFGFSW